MPVEFNVITTQQLAQNGRATNRLCPRLAAPGTHDLLHRLVPRVRALCATKLFFLLFLGTLVRMDCSADSIYLVTLNTSSLLGNADAPFAIDFQLTSGNTSSGVVNSAVLSQFSFGTGGSAGRGRPFANSGNSGGSLASTVSLSTIGGSFFNEFSQFFTAGDSLSFKLDLTTNAQSPASPDEFAFDLIDNTDGQIPTTDPSGSGALAVIDITGSNLQPQIYTTDGDGVSITPQIAAQGSPAREPTSQALLATGVIITSALFLYRRRKSDLLQTKGKEF